MLSVTSCVTNSVNECIWVKPITYTNADIDVISDELAKSILEHNKKTESLCKAP
jgi:hypothetical protein